MTELQTNEPHTTKNWHFSQSRFVYSNYKTTHLAEGSVAFRFICFCTMKHKTTMQTKTDYDQQNEHRTPTPSHPTPLPNFNQPRLIGSSSLPEF